MIFSRSSQAVVDSVGSQAVDTVSVAPSLLEWIKALPSLLWFAFAVLVLLLFYRSIRYELLPRLLGLKAFGVEFAFVRHALDRAAAEAKTSVSQRASSGVLRRAETVGPALQGLRVLWVDDRPQNNEEHIRLLRSLGIVTHSVTTTDEAVRVLAEDPYDVVVSDMERAGDSQAGLKLRDKMLLKGKTARPLVFYVGRLEPGVPAHAFGITNQPDELLHLLMDVAERVRM